MKAATVLSSIEPALYCRFAPAATLDAGAMVLLALAQLTDSLYLGRVYT